MHMWSIFKYLNRSIVNTVSCISQHHKHKPDEDLVIHAGHKRLNCSPQAPTWLQLSPIALAAVSARGSPCPWLLLPAPAPMYLQWWGSLPPGVCCSRGFNGKLRVSQDTEGHGGCREQVWGRLQWEGVGSSSKEVPGAAVEEMGNSGQGCEEQHHGAAWAHGEGCSGRASRPLVQQGEPCGSHDSWPSLMQPLLVQFNGFFLRVWPKGRATPSHLEIGQPWARW